MTLTDRDKARLIGVHPDLVKVIERAAQLTPIDFIVTEGKRTMQRQRELVHSGASQTLLSRHLTGHAVDIAPRVAGVIRWDWPLFHRIAPAFKQAAHELAVAVEWGGDWKRFPDGPHFQLDQKRYPS